MWLTRIIPLIFVLIKAASAQRIPLRILTQFDSTLDSLDEPQRDLIQGSLLPAVTQWVEDNIQVDPQPDGVLRISRRCIMDVIIPRGSVNQCVKGCESEQHCGTHIIPKEQLGQCVNPFTPLPTISAGEGVSESFILFVSAGKCDGPDTANSAVQGKHCLSSNRDTGRPTHGYMQFCTQELDDKPAKYEERVHKTLQRMLHILALERTLVSRFVDPQGMSYTNPIRAINRNYDTATGTITKSLSYITLPTVLEEVKAHFGCDEVPGAQLESEENVDSENYVYLEKLFFGNELMTGGLEGRGVLSRITWAILKDSGWYSLSRDFTEPLLWGKGAGCSFALKFCYEQLEPSGYNADSVAPFCVEPNHSKCAADRRGFGKCNIGQATELVPLEYQNFDSSFQFYSPDVATVGMNVFADRCPFYQHNIMCADISHQPQLNSFGEEYSGFSRCFDFAGDWTSTVQNVNQKSSGCYPIECGTEQSYTIRVGKSVYTCSTAGETVQVQSNIRGIVFNGTVICPDYNVVCASQTECTKDCQGNGKCVVNDDSTEQCVCYPGYHGEECKFSYGVDYCSLIPCQAGETCVNEEQGSFRCECTGERTGVFCHISSSSCTPTSCYNGGRCEDRDGDVTCICPGYSGDKCQQKLELCQEDNNCQNGAPCYVNPNSELEFECVCPLTFEGNFCESVKNCEIIGPLACKNGGQCQIKEPMPYCQCLENYMGDFCQIEVCISESTCNGHGTCLEDYFTQTLTCSCHDGYTGNRCQFEGGDTPSQLDQCVVLSRCDIVEGARVCRDGYAGWDCMSTDYCLYNDCDFGNSRCVNLDDTFKCNCFPGWTGEYCTEMTDIFKTEPYTTPSVDVEFPTLSNLCDSHPCQNSADCFSDGRDYFCYGCPREFKGKDCDEPRGQCYKEPCNNGGSCAEGQDVTQYFCTCSQGWTGPTCEEAVDPCEMLDCQNGGECVQLGQSATCTCPMGYGGLRCELPESHCYAEPCKNEARCEYHPDDHSFTCRCPLGYLGQTCSEVMENSCELRNNCSNGTPCVGSLEDYYCNCPTGLEGDYCEINPNNCVGNPCQRILFSRCKDLIGGHECACMPGFEKKSNQCGDINECTKNNPCANGICINLPGKYRCMCRAGWKGTNCDEDFDECKANADKCLNGASCKDLIADYECECVDGYKGDYCEIPPQPCDFDPCEQDAPCRNINATHSQCTCPSGFVGEKCETNFNECIVDPCAHGNCIDGINSRSCECYVGWGGWACSIYVGQCLEGKDPCLNGATCVDLADSEYECQCTTFFTGDLCQENIDDCAGDPCDNGGNCTDGLGEFTCTCPAEWSGLTCLEDVNECDVTPDICQNNAACVNFDGGYRCDCRDGFEGDVCETNTDDCVDHQCGNGGVCVDDVAGYNCDCPENYKGARCGIEVQKCKPDSCLNNGTCSVVDNVIRCDCSDTGFEGSRCETEIDECEYITCLHGGSCIDRILGYHCECPCAFTGPICEEEVDFCVDNPCTENAYMCISEVNSCDYRCQCQEGWEGRLCESNVDECADSPCVHGTCTDGINEYTCACEEGYEGRDCDEALDKCAAEPCKNGAGCETIVVGDTRHFQCNCTTHYFGEACEEKRPPCYVNPCGDHGLCQPDGESEVCGCDDGFEGDVCEINIDDCEGGPCKNGATCEDKILDFSCNCMPGYGGKTCETLKDPCTTPGLCQNNATCVECVGEVCEERYTCTCLPGYAGTYCEEDVDDCVEEPCVSGFCKDRVNDYECLCYPGYEGKDCDSDINECEPNPCFYENECVDLVGNYSCECVGYSGRNCEEDFDECKSVEVMCENGGECKNSLGSYSCICPEGFGGDHCERIVEPCDSEPCQNLATCHNLDVREYRCDCMGGYTGVNCEVPSELCNDRNNDCDYGMCVEKGGRASCICDTGYMGKYCDMELCRPGICNNGGTCENTSEGFECTCPLPWVGWTCEKKASILEFKATSRATVPLGDVTQSSVRLKMGLKIKDMRSEQQVFEQSTNLGRLTLKLLDSTIQLTLDDIILRIPLVDEFATVSVILVENYLELIVGNQTEVSLFSEAKDVSPNSGLQFGAVPISGKREAVSSFTGCFIDIDDNLDIINMAEGEGFGECGESDEFDNLQEPTDEAPIPCENGGVKVGPYCQCLDGYRGDLCEVVIGNNCQSLECPGDCRETSRGPQCVCSWPKEGELCTDLTIIPSFRADSSLVFEGERYKKLDSSLYELTLEINPEYPRGFIVALKGSSGFCTMYLDGNIIFECSVSGAFSSSVEHPDQVRTDSWSLVQVYINHDTMSISVNDNKKLFYNSLSEVLNLNGSIVFGSIPDDIDISGTNVETSSIPGFFGEIHPITLNGVKADLDDSIGERVVSAKTRDTTEPYEPACSTNPCGEGNMCYERARGYGCMCELMSGPDCTEQPSLLSFYGSTESCVAFKTKYEESNEFRIRFKGVSNDGILLYGASRYKNDTAPESFFYLALAGGDVIFGVYQEPDTFKTLSLPTSPDKWNTITLTLHPQKAALHLHEVLLDSTVRTKFSLVDLFQKNTIYIGGTKDYTGINHLNDNFEANIPDNGFFGEVSEVALNGESLMGSLSRVDGATVGGILPTCAISPCVSGMCVADTCTCDDNDFKSGELCNETQYFEPIRVTDGYVAYHKHFDVGVHLTIKFSSPLIGTEGDTVLLRINTMFVEDQDHFLEFKLNDFEFSSKTVKKLAFIRKMKSIAVLSGETVVMEKEFSSDIRLDKEFFIGLGSPVSLFTGRIYLVEADGEKLVPVHGSGVSEGTYPPCYYEPCLNGGDCVETAETEFACNCSAGYSGPYCNQLIDMCEPYPCNETSRCFSVEGTSFICQPCSRGYRGTECEEKAFCELLEPCTFGERVGDCTETEDGYHCECGDGKERQDCDLSNTCMEVVCQNNGTCLEYDDGFECECSEAFEGRHCEVPVDNCTPDACQNSGTCVSVYDERKYFCLCPLGYSGDECEMIDDMCTEEPCKNNGVCSTVPGMFLCDCPEPYFGQDCSRSPCDSLNCYQGECHFLNATHAGCTCNPGFTGELCDEDINECLNNLCSNRQGRCTNTFGDYDCECFPGFAGKDCETNIDDCDPDPCSGHGLCMDGYDSYTCLCDALYLGENCTEKSDKCSPDPCQNDAICYNYGIDHFCICPAGYEGVNCSVNTDDCRFNRCENGATCVDQLSGYSCDCGSAFAGMFCEYDVNECINSPCSNGGECTNTRGGFTCECSQYYTGHTCEVSLGECHGDPCQNGGECYEIGAVGEGRVCRCLEGWTGEECESRITECSVNTCQNGGRCRVNEEGYSCDCFYPHAGPNCRDTIIVPHLESSESVIIYDPSMVDLVEGFEFRFRPEKSGSIFHLTYNDFYLSAVYTEEQTLVLNANLEGAVYTLISTGFVPLGLWNKVHLQANANSITVELNAVFDTMTFRTNQLETILRRRHQFYIGDPDTRNSLVGCFYDLGQDMGTTGTEYDGIVQCEEGNTCVPGHTGPCGMGGECSNVGHCNCPLGRTGLYCEKASVAVSPSFNRDSYILLEGTDSETYVLQLGAQGTGAVFVGYDKEDREVISLVIESTHIRLSGMSEETVYIKGYAGAWLDLTMTFDSEEQGVFVEVGTGEEMMTVFEGARGLNKLYLGGSPSFGNNFRGCFTELTLDGGEPVYAEQVKISECAMQGCYEDACRRSVNSGSQCVSKGPRYFSCHCGPNFVGPECDVLWNRQTPRFTGNSFLKFLNPENATKEDDLMFSIVFKVTEKSGVLFSTDTTDSDVDYLSAGLSRGRVYLSYDLGAGPAYVRSPRRVDDGKWHFLHVTLRGRHAVIMVDRWASEVVSPGQRNVLNMGPSLYLGGTPTEPGITGCVESISVRNEPLTMSDTVASSNIAFCEDNIPQTSIYNFKYRL